MATTNIERYLTDLAYALDYAYNSTEQSPSDLAVRDGQTSPLRENITTTCYGSLGRVMCGCNVSANRHKNDLISSVLKLRNPSNLASGTQTVTSDNIVCGYSAYDSSGNLITGCIACKTINDICLSTNCSNNDNVSSNNKYTVANRYPVVNIPKGCYAEDITVGFDLQAYNPTETYAQSTTSNPTTNDWTSLSEKPAAHNCLYLKITQPKGLMKPYALQKQFTGPAYIPTKTVTINSNMYGSGSCLISGGYYPNQVTFSYCVSTPSSTTAPPTQYWDNQGQTSLGLMPAQGWWGGNTTATTGITCRANGPQTINSLTGSVSYPSGFYTKDHSVTVTAVSHFTYIIDSDTKFQNWVDNKSGYDYSNILIKAGTWKASTTKTTVFDYTSSGVSYPKVIIGEEGSQLELTLKSSTHYIFRSSSIRSDMYIEGVYLKISSSSTASIIYAYYNFANLINCTVDFTGSNSSTRTVYGFYYGGFFSDCTVLVDNVGSAYGFYGSSELCNCTYLHNSSSSNGGRGFYSCERLSNCRAVLTGDINGSDGFQNCTKLSNCDMVGNNLVRPIIGFAGCNYITNCSCKITTSSTASSRTSGFDNCTRVISCRAELTFSGTGSTPTNIIGFGYSYRVMYCNSDAPVKYKETYADGSYTPANAAANTVNGGWNV